MFGKKNYSEYITTLSLGLLLYVRALQPKKPIIRCIVGFVKKNKHIHGQLEHHLEPGSVRAVQPKKPSEFFSCVCECVPVFVVCFFMSLCVFGKKRIFIAAAPPMDKNLEAHKQPYPPGVAMLAGCL